MRPEQLAYTIADTIRAVVTPLKKDIEELKRERAALIKRVQELEERTRRQQTVLEELAAENRALGNTLAAALDPRRSSSSLDLSKVTRH
jgi:predicted nuclease with TOPRIM domain